MQPRITLVTPCYNQSAFVEQTLRSVLDQQYPALEYIVVDGGSSDGSAEIVQRYSDRLAWWVSEPDGGQSAAINKGFAHSSGEIMGWLNSDDLLLPGALALVGEVFARCPQIAWLTGRNANIDAAGHPSGFSLTFGKFRPLIRRGWYHGRGLGFIRQESSFWRRELWDRAGAQVDETRSYSMDFDLWQRFARYADLVSVDAVLAAFRVHPAQKTAQLGRYYAEAGVRLPAFTRAISLPLRAALTPLAWRLAPRVIHRADGWKFVPGRYFTPGIG